LSCFIAFVVFYAASLRWSAWIVYIAAFVFCTAVAQWGVSIIDWLLIGTAAKFRGTFVYWLLAP
jgi:hypothetical protein